MKNKNTGGGDPSLRVEQLLHMMGSVFESRLNPIWTDAFDQKPPSSSK